MSSRSAESLPRGQVLVLGGDQVYPSAEWDPYQERFVAPFNASLPFLPARDAPATFALPGNHDWYDGLTSFMRQFCSQRSIGAWQTVQARSYFAIKLAEGRWLWAFDTQFDTYIDYPQLSYFWAMANKLSKGDEVILVTAKPSWVTKGKDPVWNGPEVPDPEDVPQSWQTLAFIEENLIAKREATLRLTLTAMPTITPTTGGPGTRRAATRSPPGAPARSCRRPTRSRRRSTSSTTSASRTRRKGERTTWERSASSVFPSIERSREYSSLRSLFSPWLGYHTPTFALLAGGALRSLRPLRLAGPREHGGLGGGRNACSSRGCWEG